VKEHKSTFDVECSKVLDHRKQAKLQCLQNPSETHGDNLNNFRLEASKSFGKKKGIFERKK
jgi:hypothetical protein